jgi:hypothetical protein
LLPEWVTGKAEVRPGDAELAELARGNQAMLANIEIGTVARLAAAVLLFFALPGKIDAGEQPYSSDRTPAACLTRFSPFTM